MERPSSTSSSSPARRPVVAGLLAAALVLAVDRVVLGPHGPWRFLQARAVNYLQLGVATDRLELARLRAAPEGTRRAIVAGTSRADAAWCTELLDPQELRGWEFARIAHQLVTPFAIRTFAREAAGCGPDVVVLPLSEFDTHHPIEFAPGASFGDATALLDYAGRAGPAEAWRERVSIERLLVASLLRSYRYRSVLREALFDRWRTFGLEHQRYRSARRRSRLTQWTQAHAAGEDDPAQRTARLVDEAQGGAAAPRKDWYALFPDPAFLALVEETNELLGRRMPYTVYAHLREMRRGPHVAVQFGLVEDTVAILRAAGSAVLVVEAPLHPIGARFYDPSLRQEFLASVARLQREHGVLFLPLERSGPFAAADFTDLTHLNEAGSARFTRAVLTELAELDRPSR